jgi:hypothetical protein
MTNFFTGASNRFKRNISTVSEDSTGGPKLRPKKSLLIDVAESKELRETDATLSSTPKNLKAVQSTDFCILRFLGGGKFGAVYLVR